MQIINKGTTYPIIIIIESYYYIFYVLATSKLALALASS